MYLQGTFILRFYNKRKCNSSVNTTYQITVYKCSQTLCLLKLKTCTSLQWKIWHLFQQFRYNSLHWCMMWISWYISTLCNPNVFTQTVLISWIWGSHSGDYEEYDLLVRMPCISTEVHWYFVGMLIDFHQAKWCYNPDHTLQSFFHSH